MQLILQLPVRHFGQSLLSVQRARVYKSSRKRQNTKISQMSISIYYAIISKSIYQLDIMWRDMSISQLPIQLDITKYSRIFLGMAKLQSSGSSPTWNFGCWQQPTATTGPRELLGCLGHTQDIDLVFSLREKGNEKKITAFLLWPWFPDGYLLMDICW